MFTLGFRCLFILFQARHRRIYWFSSLARGVMFLWDSLVFRLSPWQKGHFNEKHNEKCTLRVIRILSERAAM